MTQRLRFRLVMQHLSHQNMLAFHGDDGKKKVYPLIQAEGTEVAYQLCEDGHHNQYSRQQSTLVGVAQPLPAPRNVNLLTYSSQLLHHYSSKITGPPTPAIDPVLTQTSASTTACHQKGLFQSGSSSKGSKGGQCSIRVVGMIPSSSSGSQVSPTWLD